MRQFLRYKTQWTIAIIIAFVLSRLLGLHAHGHVEIEHAHDVDVIAHEHINQFDKMHSVIAMDDEHHQLLTDSPHGEMTFEIEPDLIAKKIKLFSAEKFLYFFLALVIASIVVWRIGSFRWRDDGFAPFSVQHFSLQPPLRAPPRR